MQIIVVNLLLTLFPEFQARHFRKSLPGGKLGTGTPVLVELFAGKYEQERWAKIKFGQIVDEQGIMLVGRVSTNRPKNSLQFVTETALFHVNARCNLSGGLRGVHSSRGSRNVG